MGGVGSLSSVCLCELCLQQKILVLDQDPQCWAGPGVQTLQTPQIHFSHASASGNSAQLHPQGMNFLKRLSVSKLFSANTKEFAHGFSETFSAP